MSGTTVAWNRAWRYLAPCAVAAILVLVTALPANAVVWSADHAVNSGNTPHAAYAWTGNADWNGLTFGHAHIVVTCNSNQNCGDSSVTCGPLAHNGCPSYLNTSTVYWTSNSFSVKSLHCATWTDSRGNVLKMPGQNVLYPPCSGHGLQTTIVVHN